MAAMKALRKEYGDRFGQVFKTITVNDGPEFANLAEVAEWGAGVYFAHPYSSWEQPQNKRHNGLFRQYVPKGVPIERFSDEEILAFADELNGHPRRKLGYRTPEELFEAFLRQGLHRLNKHLPFYYNCPTSFAIYGSKILLQFL